MPIITGASGLAADDEAPGDFDKDADGEQQLNIAAEARCYAL